MAKHVVAKVSDVPQGGRLLLTLQGRSVGIFNVGGRFYALLNRCPHMGADLCRGSILGRLDADGPGEFRYDDSKLLLRCPWHGWEYDLETGQSYFDSRVRPYPVGVESGEQVRDEVEAGDAKLIDEGGSPKAGVGLPAPGLRLGPYVAETFPIAIEDDYLVVTMPGGRGKAPKPSPPTSTE